MSGQLNLMSCLVLASASPRRAQLLEQIGVDFIQYPANIIEQKDAAESPEEFVKRMAKEKANAAFQALTIEFDVSNSKDQIWVLACDTSIVLDRNVLGKPKNFEHAKTMWQALSNREHQVLTSLYLMRDGQSLQALSTNAVVFDVITDDQMHKYWESEEPQDKAGGYAVQGKAALWIKSISGSYSSIMGLPLFETGQLLTKAGFKLWP